MSLVGRGGRVAGTAQAMRRKLGGFAPSDVANLHSWFQADDIALADGAQVTSWDDKSGLGHNALWRGAAGTETPPSFVSAWRNGHSAVRFGGTANQFLSTDTFTAIPESTVFVVGKLATGAHTSADNVVRTLLGSIATTARLIMFKSSLGWWTVHRGASVESTVATDDLAHYMTAVFGATDVLRLDGAQIVSGNAGTNAPTGWCIGSYDSGNGLLIGDIAEILIYNRALTAQEITDVEGYLANRYAL